MAYNVAYIIRHTPNNKFKLYRGSDVKTAAPLAEFDSKEDAEAAMMRSVNKDKLTWCYDVSGKPIDEER